MSEGQGRDDEGSRAITQAVYRAIYTWLKRNWAIGFIALCTAACMGVQINF